MSLQFVIFLKTLIELVICQLFINNYFKEDSLMPGSINGQNPQRKTCEGPQFSVKLQDPNKQFDRKTRCIPFSSFFFFLLVLTRNRCRTPATFKMELFLQCLTLSTHQNYE